MISFSPVAIQKAQIPVLWGNIYWSFKSQFQDHAFDEGFPDLEFIFPECSTMRYTDTNMFFASNGKF